MNILSQSLRMYRPAPPSVQRLSARTTTGLLHPPAHRTAPCGDFQDILLAPPPAPCPPGGLLDTPPPRVQLGCLALHNVSPPGRWRAHAWDAGHARALPRRQVAGSRFSSSSRATMRGSGKSCHSFSPPPAPRHPPWPSRRPSCALPTACSSSLASRSPARCVRCA